jgi:hypothetical protein
LPAPAAEPVDREEPANQQGQRVVEEVSDDEQEEEEE